MSDLLKHSNKAELVDNLEEVCVPEPFNRPLDAFLAGKAERDLDIDRRFSADFREALKSYSPGTLKYGRGKPSVLAAGYKLGPIDAATDKGIVLLSSIDEVVGFYLGCFLGIATEHQGLGLGAELVFDFALTFGELPVWFLDVPAYSPSGLSAHRRAWHLARNSEFIRAKGIKIRKRIR